MQISTSAVTSLITYRTVPKAHKWTNNDSQPTGNIPGKEDMHLVLSLHLQHYVTYIGSLFTAAQFYNVEMARLLVLLSSM